MIGRVFNFDRAILLMDADIAYHFVSINAVYPQVVDSADEFREFAGIFPVEFCCYRLSDLHTGLFRSVTIDYR